MSIRRFIRHKLWDFGVSLNTFSPSTHQIARNRTLLNNYTIDWIWDIGANRGDYVLYLRKELGYKGQIVSVEPLTTAYEELEGLAKTDSKLKTHKTAIGMTTGEVDINISQNSYSSSILPMLEMHWKVAAESKYVGTEKVRIIPFSELYEMYKPIGNQLLKIDTQGFEMEVLKSAVSVLPNIDIVYLEMSLTPLYEGEVDFTVIVDFMKMQGFNIFSLTPGFSDLSTGRMLQVDGTFVKMLK